MNTTWIRYPHTVEIWEMTRTTNYSGQRMPTWTRQDTVPCFYVPISSRERVSPTFAIMDRDEMYIPPINANGDPIVITYNTRFKNIRDIEGNVIRGNADAAEVISNDDLLRVHSLIKHTGWAGKLRFYQVITMTAVEKA